MCGRFTQYENFTAMLRHLTLTFPLVLVGNMKILADIMCAPAFRLSFSTREKRGAIYRIAALGISTAVGQRVGSKSYD